MRLAKVQSLRRDLTVLAQSHERDVDRKDALVQMLDRDLEEAEEQYQMALRSHMSQCDKLIDLQDSRLLSMEKDFKQELSIIVNEFEKEGTGKKVRNGARACTSVRERLCEFWKDS